MHLDTFSAVLGAMMGCIALVVVLSGLIGLAYRERSLLVLALIGLLHLAYLWLGGASVWTQGNAHGDSLSLKIAYFVGLAVSILLPILVLGQSGASKRPALSLLVLSASCLPLAVADVQGLGLVVGALFMVAWALVSLWYFWRNWRNGKPWIVWLALGQLVLWLAWTSKYVLEFGLIEASPRTVLLASASHLMLFSVACYVAFVWRSRLLSLERLQSSDASGPDALTGLSVRDEFLVALARVSKRTSRMGYTSGILVLESPNLAQFSSDMGGDNSEIALLAIARILRRCARPQDWVARISDQRFAVLLDGVDPDLDASSLSTKIVSHGLRLSSRNLQGRGLVFSIVASPIAGKAHAAKTLLATLLRQLDAAKSSSKAIHMVSLDHLPADESEWTPLTP